MRTSSEEYLVGAQIAIQRTLRQWVTLVGQATILRFMESLHDFSVAHWDHEPLRLTEARSGPRVCDPQPARFMESLGATEFSFREVEERRVQAARMLRCFRAHAG